MSYKWSSQLRDKNAWINGQKWLMNAYGKRNCEWICLEPKQTFTVTPHAMDEIVK